MAKMYHVVIGSMEPIALFRSEADERRMRDYLRIYKERTQLENFGYSFSDYRLHLIVRDKLNRVRDFLLGVSQAFSYYYQTKHDTDVKLRSKQVEIDPKKDLFHLLRFVHSQGRNSSKDYRDYSRYIKHDLLDMGPVLATLHADEFMSKELFFNEMIKENEYSYTVECKRREQFELDKMSKRHQRARDFMDDFLKEKQLTRRQLLSGSSDLTRIELIDRYRKETDLSFRDIGHVFGLSHTSIIRMYRQKDDAIHSEMA